MAKKYKMVRVEESTHLALQAIQANWQDNLDSDWACKLAEGAEARIDLNAVITELIRRDYEHKQRSIDKARRTAFEDWFSGKANQVQDTEPTPLYD